MALDIGTDSARCLLKALRRACHARKERISEMRQCEYEGEDYHHGVDVEVICFLSLAFVLKLTLRSLGPLVIVLLLAPSIGKGIEAPECQ